MAQSKGQCVNNESRFTVDCFTEQTLDTHGHPENSYEADTLEGVYEIIKNVSRQPAGIRRVDVWINEPFPEENNGT